MASWCRGSGCVLLLLLPGLLLPGCGRPGDEAAGNVNPLRAVALDLPLVGTVGVEPPVDRRVVISVTRDGWLHLPDGSEPVGLDRLREWLARKADDPKLRDPDGSSRLGAILDIDASIPWVAAQWIMQTCAASNVKIYRIHFGARSTKDGAAGVLSAALPKDVSCRGPWDGPEQHRVRVKLFGTAEAFSDVQALYAALMEMPEETRREAFYELVAPPPKGGRVPHGTVMEALDVLLAAGAEDIVFEGAAMRHVKDAKDGARAFRQAVVALRGQAHGLKIRVNDRTLGLATPGDPVIPARGRLTGVWGVEFWDPDHDPEEEEVPEEEGLVDEPFVEDPSGEEVVEGPLPPRPRPFLGPSFSTRGNTSGAFRGRAGLAESEDERASRAIDDGLAWLAAHQSPNGGWEAAGFARWCNGKAVPEAGRALGGAGKAEYDVGVTGLALGAFLGAGFTNRGRHPFAKVVSKGLRYLKNLQDPEGCFGPRSSERYLYNHATAALAMVEAYGMTGSPIFKGSAQRSLDFIALSRNPRFGWRYGIKPGSNDTSATGWMCAVLHSATMINEDARKRGKPPPLTPDEEAFKGIRAWLDEMTDPVTGRVGYMERGGLPARAQEMLVRFPSEMSEAMTAVGMHCRILLGEDPRTSGRLRDGAALIEGRLPWWAPQAGTIDMVYWYHGTLAAWQVGGRTWERWQPSLWDALLAHQHLEGDACRLRGSWDPAGVWGRDGGRVYATALMTMCLEVMYRYPRVFGDR